MLSTSASQPAELAHGLVPRCCSHWLRIASIRGAQIHGSLSQPVMLGCKEVLLSWSLTHSIQPQAPVQGGVCWLLECGEGKRAANQGASKVGQFPTPLIGRRPRLAVWGHPAAISQDSLLSMDGCQNG